MPPPGADRRSTWFYSRIASCSSRGHDLDQHGGAGIGLDASAASETALIGHIYDAVIEPARWTDTIDRIRRHFGFHIAMMGVSQLPSGNVIIDASSNVPASYVEAAKSYGAEMLDMWGGPKQIARLPIEEPLGIRSLPAGLGWAGNAYYEEWARPQGLVDQVVLLLESSPQMLANLSLGVHESRPVISDEQIEGVRLIAPHMRRAVIISGLLESRAEAAASFEAALSGLGSAVLLVDEAHAGRLRQSEGREDAAERRPDRPAGGQTQCAAAARRGYLEATVAAAAVNGAVLARASSGIAARRRDGSGAIVHVLPLQRQMDRAGWRPVAAVFVAEPNAPLNMPVEALKLLYGLRPAEAASWSWFLPDSPAAALRTYSALRRARSKRTRRGFSTSSALTAGPAW